VRILAGVKTSLQGQFAKAARNDPCPCGSGLKFKRYHGRAWREAIQADPKRGEKVALGGRLGALVGAFCPGGTLHPCCPDRGMT
jgi:hypothetical protein